MSIDWRDVTGSRSADVYAYVQYYWHSLAQPMIIVAKHAKVPIQMDRLEAFDI
jgi:hypothetical protein